MAETRAKKTVAAVAKKAAAPTVAAPIAAAKVKAVAAPKPKAKTVAKIEAAPTVKAVAAKIKTVSSKTIATSTKGMTDMTDTVKKVAAEAGEKATAMFKDVNVRAKDMMSKGGEMSKDVMEFNKANMEAIVASGKISAKGAQTAAQTAVDLTKKNWEANTTHVKALTGVRAPADLFQMQTEFARKQFDSAVAEMSKNTEVALKLAGEVVAPIRNRYAVVVEQVKGRMAS